MAISNLLVKGLKTTQNLLSEEEETLRQLRDSFNKEHKELLDNISNLKNSIVLQKEPIEKAALKEYEGTGNKKLLGGIGIREKNTISYDGKAAFNFAKEKDMFLTLDVKAFEKAIPGLNLDFVTSKKVPQVTFPKEIKLED